MEEELLQEEDLDEVRELILNSKFLELNKNSLIQAATLEANFGYFNVLSVEAFDYLKTEFEFNAIQFLEILIF